jgi:hypothetical protein
MTKVSTVFSLVRKRRSGSELAEVATAAPPSRWTRESEAPRLRAFCPTGATGLEPATPGFGGVRAQVSGGGFGSVTRIPTRIRTAMFGAVGTKSGTKLERSERERFASAEAEAESRKLR